jgi:hypothetical protein
MIKVPDNTIAAVPYDEFYRGRQEEVYLNLRGRNKRDWFSRHAYLCLPLVIGNQYGFAMRSLWRATLLWNGGPDPADTTVTIHNTEDGPRHGSLQTMVSNFGLGIVTVQAAFALRTPPGINLMTLQPPNFFIDGLQNMTGVVETDNLRRDFTFNLKLTRANFPVEIRIGDVIAGVVPIPRGFVENFEMVDGCQMFSSEQIAEEQQVARDFGRERIERDPLRPDGVGRRYHKGEDVHGNSFVYSHQTRLKPGPARDADRAADADDAGSEGGVDGSGAD